MDGRETAALCLPVALQSPAPGCSPRWVPACSCRAFGGLQGGKFPLSLQSQGDFSCGRLPFRPRPWLLLRADGSNYRRVIAVWHSAIPVRDHCRQGCSSEKRQPGASSAPVKSWEYFSFPLSPPRHLPGSAEPDFHPPREEQSLSQARKPRKEI